jgi:SNF2 family DNA or RNA helicase
MGRLLAGTESDDLAFALSGPDSGRLLEEILATGRCYWQSIESEPLSVGPARRAEPSWKEGEGGGQLFYLDIGGAAALSTAPPWYVDSVNAVCGPIETEVPADAVQLLLSGPPILPEHSRRVRTVLAQAFGEDSPLVPKVKRPPKVLRVTPVPCLTLGTVPVRLRDSWSNASRSWNLPSALLEFDYAGHVVPEGHREIRVETPEGPVLIRRDEQAEARAWEPFEHGPWMSPELSHGWTVERGRNVTCFLVPQTVPYRQSEVDQELYRFVARTVPRLRAQGWRVQTEGYLQPPVGPPEELVASITEHGNDWFDVNLGLKIGEQTVDLRPILLSAFDRILQLGRSHEDDDGSEIFHRLPNGCLVAFPLARLRPILQGLIELFGRPEKWGMDLRLSTSRAGEAAILNEIASRSQFHWKGSERLEELSKQLARWEGVRPLEAPKGFQGDLRDYQKQGFGWLRFLADFHFGGVLADDMGLGKTVQTLAHIVSEKKLGRLDRPALVVGPTSTLPNWEAEIERFAPRLKVLKLHGPERRADFDKILKVDIVLTSYPLLARDKDRIVSPHYRLAVLDEAQNIKNPTTNVAKAAFEIKADHRIALSGTPIENNLQELWSIFRFALPGLLGTAQEFKNEYRIPIEKNGHAPSREALIRRIRPFILRRTKQQVATELPPKTIIIDRVELESAQRDLYESVRLSMDEKVRKIVASRGLDRSRIEVLDALLKLRQVCCDPRLLKIPTAKGITESAKLERLMEKLIELMAEDRKVLVFSQFTSMLDLIEPRLRAEAIDFVRLSGDTEDRATPVKRFQAGEVPLFLISLRAGGTGLNLTAADTVIHYDPWWNPAVENQATDRAHRIGQDKPVFVYKLVATGTVEEKILELQVKKADLAERLLSGSTDVATNLTAEELKWVLG